MAEDNLEIARRGFEAFNRRDWDGVAELFDPEVEWHDPPDMPGGGVHRGREAMLRRWDELADLLPGFHVDPEAFFEAGDQVVVFVRSGGRGSSSGVPVSRQLAQTFTIRDGLVVKVTTSADRASALKAAGIEQRA